MPRCCFVEFAYTGRVVWEKNTKIKNSVRDFIIQKSEEKEFFSARLQPLVTAWDRTVVASEIRIVFKVLPMIDFRYSFAQPRSYPLHSERVHGYVCVCVCSNVQWWKEKQAETHVLCNFIHIPKHMFYTQTTTNFASIEKTFHSWTETGKQAWVAKHEA